MSTPPTYLNLEQAARSAALEKASAILAAKAVFGDVKPDPADVVALARFILTGEDLYEGEEGAALAVAPGRAVFEGLAIPSTLTADDIVRGRHYVVLPGARSEGFAYADAEDDDHHPVQGTVVRAVDNGVDSDGDAYVMTEGGDVRWVLPEFLIPAV